MNGNESDKIDGRFVSTLDEPLKFFKSYLNLGGEDFLRSRFMSYYEPDGEYDEQKDLIYIQKSFPPGVQRGELLNEETNCQEYFLSFSEYVPEELVRQAERSFALINEKSQSAGNDQELKLYNKILIECTEIHRKISANVDLNFSIELDYIIKALVNKTFDKFEKYHPRTPLVIATKKYFQEPETLNQTGFKLKKQVRNSRLREFYDSLSAYSFIKDQDNLSLNAFFNGEIPKRKINWTKELNELKYFIDCISDELILEKVPGQQWKYLDDIFIFQGEQLPYSWHRNHNKLKDKKKRASIANLTNMLRPMPKS